MKEVKITTPLDDNIIEKLNAGDRVYITGIIYTARDAAHKRMVDSLKNGRKLPFDINNSIIYYVGPCPPKPGQVIGSAGPTTSYRMDDYTPTLLKVGLKGMIGKGNRSKEVINSIVENNCVYFAAIGGAGALISSCIKSSEVIAYEDLGAEAIRKLYVEDFPVIVAIDSRGNNLYDINRTKSKIEGERI
ncbi:Fe-S-containing hydro-lyase [Caloranaerobacter azorensis]|uniref:Fumarate hydratase n=2 Tax=Caloranaerobacter azorensis TaxID=116090 RepID=A0A096BI60_9FIRM|nr:Fe-S-containing hydro-lyase [Caloranaerobacter azorensis]KGG80895.1 fumarate hydratase [Caloranaerobacter azorensis H53214]QIB27807.1 Fe-S-containing hydro-lyase [Caloranaerobacter azorensis]